VCYHGYLQEADLVREKEKRRQQEWEKNVKRKDGKK